MIVEPVRPVFCRWQNSAGIPLKYFIAWYPRDGRPGLSPAQLATVCVLQYALNLSDRQAAEAVRCRIDFK